tara:strand:- start:1014 stop:1316 length:303 start_codon:yes stop_codon:yes gene_type:complete
MKQTINFYNFSDAFRKAGRADQFTYEGQRAIFDYLEEYEDSTGEEVELDVIAICCEYMEYENLEEFHNVYDKKDYPDFERLRDFTEVILVGDDSFIIASF